MLRILSICILLSFLLATPVLTADDEEGFISKSWHSITSYFTDEKGKGKHGGDGLRYANADLLAALPPDPGEAGKVTLAGIDLDNDGVRDDVQRWIVMTYPNSQKTRAGLRQLAQDYQRFILGAANSTQIYAAASSMSRAHSCLGYVLPVGQFITTVGGSLKAQMLNTYARSKAFLQADRHLSGRMYKGLPYNQRKQGCNFNPDVMPN